MDARRGDAERLFRAHRSVVYSRLNEALQALKVSGGRAGPINHKDLKYWRETWIPTHGGCRVCGDWNWQELRDSYSNNPKRLDVAIWAEDRLCALILGKRSHARDHVTLDYIESYAEAHPLQGYVLDLADIAGTVFAEQVKARKVRIGNPAPGLVVAYQSLGYVVVVGCAPPCMEKGV